MRIEETTLMRRGPSPTRIRYICKLGIVSKSGRALSAVRLCRCQLCRFQSPISAVQVRWKHRPFYGAFKSYARHRPFIYVRWKHRPFYGACFSPLDTMTISCACYSPLDTPFLVRVIVRWTHWSFLVRARVRWTHQLGKRVRFRRR